MTKTEIRCVCALTAIGLFPITTVLSEDIPRTMMRITTRVVQPQTEQDSFEAQARRLWRAGTKYACIAEAPDPQNHVHGLMVIKEPDIWMINLFDRSGRHMVDPGPSLNVHIPIFQVSEETKTELNALEFGNELDFFTRNNAKLSRGEVINGKSADRYEVRVTGRKLILWTDVKSKRPIRVSLGLDKQTRTIEYLSYEDNVPFDPAIFRPPAGIVIQDSK